MCTSGGFLCPGFSNKRGLFREVCLCQVTLVTPSFTQSEGWVPVCLVSFSNRITNVIGLFISPLKWCAS